MKNTALLTFLACFLLSACTFLSHPIQENNLSTPTPTAVSTEDRVSCAAENWKIAITSVEQAELNDGTKLIFVKIGIENNDVLWGKVTGLDDSQGNVFLKTKDGSVYDHLDHTLPGLPEQLVGQDQILYESTGKMGTPLLPPGFATLGQSINGEVHNYNFAFLIPDSKIPDSITISGMNIDCIQPHTEGENGRIIYRKKSIQIPAKTYNLNMDSGDVRDTFPEGRYANLIGADVVTPDWKERLFVTNVARNGDTITVTLDLTNFSSHAIFPSFDGYIMDDRQLFIRQNKDENEQARKSVEPGQTAQNLTWTFTVPDNEKSLLFVYVYGDNVDLNEVYRINFE